MGAVKNKWGRSKGKKKMNRQKEKKKRRGRKREHLKKWYGITSIGQYTEGIKAKLKKEGFNIFRKVEENFETKVKKIIQKSKQEIDIKEEGELYKVECKDIQYTEVKENTTLRKE